MVKLTEDGFKELQDNDGGVCLACGELAWGDTEPDAEGYKCDACGAMKVMGVELALIAGHIDIVE